MKVARSSFFFAAGTMLSRVSGLIRDQVVLGIFGASVLLDAFFIAFRIPNLFREMLAEGALGSAFTKVYSQVKEEDRKAARQLFGQAIYLSCLLAIFLSLLGFLLAPYLVALMTALSTGEVSLVLTHQAVGLTRLLFPYLGLAVVGSVVAGVLYQKGRFFLSAIAPFSFNLCYILGALVLADLCDRYLPSWWQEVLADKRLTGLSMGVLLGGCCQILMQLKAAYKDLKGYSFSLIPKLSPNVKKVLVLMGPAALAASTGPLNLIINTNFAASLGEGTITWLIAAFRLLQLPVGVFGVAIGVVVLPAISRAIARGAGEVTLEVRKTMLEGLSLVMWLMSAAGIFLITASDDIITLLFQHGKFTPADAAATAAALRAYAFGVLAYGSIKVLSSFYYAVSRTSYAMYVAIACVFVNLAGNLLLVEPFGHVGLAITTALTLTMNAFLLLVGMRRYDMKAFYLSLLKQLIFLMLLMGIVYLLQRLCLDQLNLLEYAGFLGVKWNSLAHLTVTGILTLVVFLTAGCVVKKKTPLRLCRDIFSR